MLQYYVCANCQLARCPVPDPRSNTSHQQSLEFLFRTLRGVGSSRVKWSFLVVITCHLFAGFQIFILTPTTVLGFCLFGEDFFGPAKTWTYLCQQGQCV